MLGCSKFFDLLEPRQFFAAGDLDAAFGTRGQISGSSALDLPVTNHHVDDFVSLAGGATILAGTLTLRGQSHSTAFLARLDVAGDWDRGFGDRGLVLIELRQSSARSVRATIDTAGRVLVGIEHENMRSRRQVALARVTADGELDQAFGTRGIWKSDSRRNQALVDVTATADGRPLLAANMLGRHDAVSGVVYRLLTSGALDSSFGQQGTAGVDAVAGEETYSAITLEGNQIILGGVGLSNGGDDDGLVVRFRHDGSLDRSFSGNGIAAFGHADKDDRFHAVFVDDANRPVLVLSRVARTVDHYYFVTNEVELSVRRATKAGELDSAFGAGGTALVGEPLELDAELNLNFALTATVTGLNNGYRIAFSQQQIQSSTTSIYDLNGNGSIYRVIGVGTIDEPFYYHADARLVGIGIRGDNVVVAVDLRDESNALMSIVASATVGDSNELYGGFDLAAQFVPERSFNEFAVTPAGNLLVTSQLPFGSLVGQRSKNGALLPFEHGPRLLLTGRSDRVFFNRPEVFPDGSFHLSGAGPDTDGDYFSLDARRFLATGEYDPRGDNGYFDENRYAYMAAQPRGDTLLSYRYFGDENDRRVVITPTGDRLETSFAVIGQAVPNFTGDYNSLFFSDAVSWRSTGVVSTGSVVVRDQAGNQSDVPITIRQHPDGSLDRSFGNNGVLKKRFDDLLAVQADGALLYLTPEGFLARRRPDGRPDLAFGRNGVIGIAGDFTVDAKDRIILNRQLSNGDTQVFRYTPNGKTDRSFGGGDGIVVVDAPISQNAKLMVLPDNKLLVTGYRATAEGVEWSATRVLG